MKNVVSVAILFYVLVSTVYTSNNETMDDQASSWQGQPAPKRTTPLLVPKPPLVAKPLLGGKNTTHQRNSLSSTLRFRFGKTGTGYCQRILNRVKLFRENSTSQFSPFGDSMIFNLTRNEPNKSMDTKHKQKSTTDVHDLLHETFAEIANMSSDEMMRQRIEICEEIEFLHKIKQHLDQLIEEKRTNETMHE
eukprot:207831_1